MSDTLILEWSRDVNLHDSILVPDSVKQKASSTPFILEIHGIEGGQVDPSSLLYSLTLFHSRSCSFFGRTFSFDESHTVYYHSKIVDEEAFGACEVIQISRDNPSEQRLLGFCKLYCFTERNAENSPVFSGSSRNLLSTTTQSLIQGISLKYSVKVYNEFSNVFNIVPFDTFCGPNDLIPGVKDRRIVPNQRIVFERSANLTINNIVVSPALEIDQKVYMFIEKYQKEKLGSTDNRRAKIQERKVLVGTHNTWTYTGNNGPDSAAVLRPQDTVLVSPSSITIANTFDDPLVAVVFELQYTLIVPKKAGETDDIININLGWAPHVGEKEGSFSIGLLSGPGRSISGKMLWDVTLDIEIQFDITLRGFSHAVENRISEMSPDVSNLLKESDQKNKFEIKRMQDEMNRLKDELERERKKQERDTGQKQVIPIPDPRKKMQESASQTFVLEEEKRNEARKNEEIVPEKIDPKYSNPPDYSYLDALVPASNTESRGFGTVTSQSFPKNLSRSDKARLIKSGVRGLLDYDSSFTGYNPRLDVEAQDPLKAANFVIQFLAYRQITRSKKLPENICFGLRFYHFKNLITESVHIKQGELGMPCLIEKQGVSSEMVVKFEIEACEWDQIDFAKYLLKKSLTIEIWDASSHMILGYIRAPLIELLRQGRPSVVTTKEYPIFQEFNGEQIGSLQILLRNVGIQSTLRVQPTQNPLKINGGQARHKYRAKAKPLVIDANEPSAPIGNDESRKRLRVLEFKKSLKKGSDETWEQEKNLNEISMIREQRKPLLIKQALREYMSNAQKLYVRSGQALTFQFNLQNPHDHEECFTLVINDSDLSIVKSPAEWQWWVLNKNYDKPLDYDLITEDNSVVLRPGENCPILFKYFSWNPESKMVSAWIHQSRGTPLCALELELVPEPSPVDHVMHYYECENRTIRLRLPPLFTSEITSKPILQCSLPKTVVQWETENEISVELKVPNAPNTITFNIVAYEDIYCNEIKANWEIRMHSLVGMDVSVTMGQSTSVRITCPGDEARTVTLFSSHNDVVMFPPPHNKPFTLMPRTVNNLPVIVRSDLPILQSVRVHCVDVFHKLLIHAWIFKIQTTGTNVTQVFDIKCPINCVTEKRVMFTNRSQSWAIFHFRSSNPAILDVKEPRLPLEGGAKGFLPVIVTPPHAPSIAEVSVFANDSEENIFECMLFKIDFST